VPGKALGELSRVINDSQDSLRLFMSQGMMHVMCGEVSLHSRLLEGTFPDYRRVLPQDFTRRVRIGKDALQSGLQRMLVVAQEKQSPNLVVFQFGEGQLNLTANTPDLGIGQEEISVVLEGDPLTIAFNGRYWIDILAVLDCEEVQLSFQDGSRSGVISPYGDEDFRYVVMPVRLRDDNEAGE
jgi:DNA polymerase-3 subunit beta